MGTSMPVDAGGQGTTVEDLEDDTTVTPDGLQEGITCEASDIQLCCIFKAKLANVP